MPGRRMQEGTKAMETYYNPEDLDKFSTMGEEAPELWDLYMAYYGKVFAEGALTAREKALIALAVVLDSLAYIMMRKMGDIKLD